MPLGRGLIDDFTRATAFSDVDAQETLEYTLRFKRAESSSAAGEPVVQDRSFNAIEETNAFLGPAGGSVRQCTYTCCEPGAPHGRLVLQIDDAPDEGGGGGGSSQEGRASAMTTGSTRVELTVLWAQWGAASDGAFVTSELIRQRVTRAADVYEPRAQDETSFVEILTRFERERERKRPTEPSTPAPARRVFVRNRIAQYLSLPGIPTEDLAQGDEAEEASSAARRVVMERFARAARARESLAGGRAISFFDYNWQLQRVVDSAVGGRGGVA